MSEKLNSKHERALQYLARAAEALLLAEAARGESARAEFIRLAASWRALAARTEQPRQS